MVTVGEIDGVVMNWNEFESREALNQAVVDRVQMQLMEGLLKHASISMALSGGSTPMPIYAQLAGEDIAWDRIACIATDERWVSRDHPANNTHQIRQHLGDTGAKIFDLVPEALGDNPESDHAKAVLKDLPMPLEVAVVGMGADAHFASLFPNTAALQEGLDANSSVSVLPVMPDPLPVEAPYGRITLSLTYLLTANALILVITGDAKRAVLERVIKEAPDPREAPIAALITAAGQKLEVYWSP